MIKHLIAAAVVTAATVLSGCQREQTDGPVELSGRIFVFNYRVSTATYLVTLKKTGEIPDGSSAVAEFENPMGGEPLVTREKIFAHWDKITLESPDLHCVVKDRPYAVTIRLLGPDGKALQTIDTTITSNLDQSVLAAKPLVVGPAYERNPEVFKKDGKADYSGDPLCRT